MAGTGISRGRGGIEWSGMVATQLFEIDGRIDGVGRFWLERLSTTGSTSGSLYEECGMDNPRKIPLLRNRDASADRRNSPDRDDRRWASNQARRESVAPGKWRRDRHL